MNIPKLNPPLNPSTNVLGVGYDPIDRILYIDFKGTGLYSYHDFDEKKYAKLLTAGSVGRFISSEVIPNHFMKKISKII